MKIFRYVCGLLPALLLGISAVAMAGHVDNFGIQVDYVPGDPPTTTITEFTDYGQWVDAVGCELAANRYAELGGGVTVTDQYVPVGALYTDGNDVTYVYAESTDGMLLNGNGRVNIDFSYEITAIGVNFPGAVRIVGYMDGSLVFTSSDFGGAGTFFFGGVISSDPFNSVQILDWMDDTVYPDDVFYDAEGASPVEGTTWGAIKALF